MFEKILELRDCEDDILKRDADNIYSLLGSNIVDLMGDRMDVVIKDFVNHASIFNIRKWWSFTDTCVIQKNVI